MGDKPEKVPGLPRQTPRDGGAPVHTVLIIEDTVELAEMIQVTLERMGLRVFHATHGNQALDLYHSEHPDLLLDVALPDRIGWKVLEAIHEDQRGEKAPLVLVISAYTDLANRLIGKLQEFAGYFIKLLLPDKFEWAVAAASKLPPP